MLSSHVAAVARARAHHMPFDDAVYPRGHAEASTDAASRVSVSAHDDPHPARCRASSVAESVRMTKSAAESPDTGDEKRALNVIVVFVTTLYSAGGEVMTGTGGVYIDTADAAAFGGMTRPAPAGSVT